MNEMLDSQLSAMFDDELPPAECELLARRLSKDEALQARWRHYAVIGAAARGERGLALNVDLSARVRKAIAAEEALSGAQVAGSSPQSRTARRAWQAVAGLGMAAGVAALSVLWLRSQSPPGEVVVAQAAPPATVSLARDVDGADRYVVPTTVESSPVVLSAELANYVVAHSEYSAPLSRRNLLSSLVASEAGTLPVPRDSEEADAAADATVTSAQSDAQDLPDANDQK